MDVMHCIRTCTHTDKKKEGRVLAEIRSICIIRGSDTGGAGGATAPPNTADMLRMSAQACESESTHL